MPYLNVSILYNQLVYLTHICLMGMVGSIEPQVFSKPLFSQKENLDFLNMK